MCSIDIQHRNSKSDDQIGPAGSRGFRFHPFVEHGKFDVHSLLRTPHTDPSGRNSCTGLPPATPCRSISALAYDFDV